LSKQVKVNHQIQAPEVQLIDQKGRNLGKTRIEEARKKADNAGLDLVLVAEKASPPVARIMDHGKHQYQQKKKEQKSKTSGEMKEIRISLNIEAHDIDFKLKKAQNFLEKNHPLKVSLTLFGRQQSFGERAKEQVNGFIRRLNKISEIEQPLKREGRSLYAILKPK